MTFESIIVDVQGFKRKDNTFIIKEFSLTSSEYTQTFLIKPPHFYSTLSNDEKRTVKWLERNNNILWSEGFVDYREFKRLVHQYLNGTKVFVKGLEKTKWIKELCSNCDVINIEEKGCPNFLVLYELYDNKKLYCVHHNKQCALRNVLCLKFWCKNNNIII